MKARTKLSKPRPNTEVARRSSKRPRPASEQSDATRLRRFADLVTRELGIRMPQAKMSMLHSRVQQRMRRLDLPTLAEYERYLFDSSHAATEMKFFIDVVTTNKTDFFREAAHFEVLTRKVLPALDADTRDEKWTCRVWCAGCSSGQEVYTLAMVLQEHAARHAGFEFSIWATDVSSRMLEQARAGIYPMDVIEPVPAALRTKYLLRSKDPAHPRVKIGPELRARVSFDRLNFMDDRYVTPWPFDVIFFRNVMIYFDKPIQEQVINRQCQHLRRGGFLFISHTENLNGLKVPLQSVAQSVFRKVS